MQCLDEQELLLGRVEDYSVGGWCRMKMRVYLVILICALRMMWSHAAMYFNIGPMWTWLFCMVSEIGHHTE